MKLVADAPEDVAHLVEERTERQNKENKLAEAGVKYWGEFRQSLILDLPPHMLKSDLDHILNSHKAAFDMGALAVLEGIKDVAETTEVLSKG